MVEKLAAGPWGVRCVLLTAFGDNEIRRRVERVGATFFEKPLDLAVLRAAVKRMGGERGQCPGSFRGGRVEGPRRELGGVVRRLAEVR